MSLSLLFIEKQVIVIGGGAAGFFAAINLAMKKPAYRISILEKSGKLLSKVKISGGGRCNVTHHCFDNSELVKNYPRGHKELLQVFSRFAVKDTIAWFEQQDVKLKIEADGRMFPISDDSQTIIDCFLNLTKKLNISILTNCDVHSISTRQGIFELKTDKGVLKADYVICATGGHPKAGSYDLVKSIGHNIEPPIPSLFTFNFPGETIKKDLQGVSVKEAQVKIKGSKLNYAGPVLITHWGLSGPAVLKLSAFAAKEFFEVNYESEIIVNWAYPLKPNDVEDELRSIQQQRPKALPYSTPCFDLPKRLWEFLCHAAEADTQRPWAETGSKTIKKLAEKISGSSYRMQGKTTFKEEFVTSGGVNLKEIDFKTMQSKIVPGLFFCGEVMNIDGITGGFNFQSAWSTAWLAANSIH